MMLAISFDKGPEILGYDQVNVSGVSIPGIFTVKSNPMETVNTVDVCPLNPRAITFMFSRE